MTLEDFIEDVSFVITYPESPGFDGEELLRAAVLGRLVPDMSSGRERILMFSEERACIHSALREFERLIPQNVSPAHVKCGNISALPSLKI